MCSYLASFPAALTHAFIARYSRPGDVVLDPFSGRGTTPLQACAEGRVGVGNDLNPFAHLLTAAKVEPATRAQAATRLAQLRLAWNAELRAAGSPSPSASSADPGDPAALVPAAGSGALAGRRHRTGPGRGRPGLPPADPRPAPVRPDGAPPRRPDRPVPGRRADRDPPRQERELPVRADAEHVLDGAALRPRLRGPDRVRVAGTRRLRRPGARSSTGCSASRRRRSRGSPCSVTRATSRRAPGRPCGHAAGPERARLVVTSPPYLRVVKYGYYNWLRTWFLGFDARDIDATLDDAHHREPYLAVPARRPGRPAARSSPTTPSSSSSSATSRPTAAARSGAASASPSGPGRPPPNPRATAWPASPSTTSRANRKMTKLWGDEAGRATKTDRILVLGATEAGRRRALAGAPLDVDWTWPPRALRSL